MSFADAERHMGSFVTRSDAFETAGRGEGPNNTLTVRRSPPPNLLFRSLLA